MSIFEYNEELHMKQEREDAMEEGIQKGEALLLMNLIKKKREKNDSLEEIANALEMDLERVQKIAEVMDQNPSIDGMEIYEMLKEDID